MAPLFFLHAHSGTNGSTFATTHSGEIMTDWNDIITEALKELQADAIFTRGAILHSKVSQIARRSDWTLITI